MCVSICLKISFFTSTFTFKSPLLHNWLSLKPSRILFSTSLILMPQPLHPLFFILSSFLPLLLLVLLPHLLSPPSLPDSRGSDEVNIPFPPIFHGLLPPFCPLLFFASTSSPFPLSHGITLALALSHFIYTLPLLLLLPPLLSFALCHKGVGQLI